MKGIGHHHQQPLDWLCGEEREESRAIPNVLTMSTAHYVSRVHITPRAFLSLAGLLNKGKDLLQHTGCSKAQQRSTQDQGLLPSAEPG